MIREVDAALMEHFANWSSPVKRHIQGRGDMYLRTADELDGDFWGLWCDHKDDIKKLGISVSKDEDTGQFTAKWWSKEYHEAPEPENIVFSWEVGQHMVRTDLSFDHVPEFQLLRPYQIPAAGTLLEALHRFKGAIDSSDVGLGKTYTAIATAKALGLNVGVVCPARVVSKWTDTVIDVFDMEPEFVLSYNKIRTGGHDKFISRHERPWRGKTKVTFKWNTCAPVLVIFDEVHECSGHDSLNSKILEAAIADPYMKVLGLSATLANSPLMMDAIGKMLGLHQGRDFWDWCLKHGARPGRFGGLQFDSRWPRAQQGLRSIHSQIYPYRGARLLRSQLKDQLPKNDIIVEVVDTPDTLPKFIQRQLDLVDEKEAQDFLNAEEKEQEVSALTINTRDRQRCELRKTVSMFEQATELLDAGRSVLVFLNFSESIVAFKDLLASHKTYKDLWYRELVGGLGKKADQVIKDFQTNKVRLLVIQTDAGSESIDLHDTDGNFPRGTVISPGYSARKLIQALGRVDRNGAKSDCIQYIIFTTDKVEKRAAMLVQGKLNNLALLNDGDISRAIQVSK
jgi:hypothetical protein